MMMVTKSMIAMFLLVIENVDVLDEMDRKYRQLSQRQYCDNDNRNNLPDDREYDDVNGNRPQVQAADPRAAFQQL